MTLKNVLVNEMPLAVQVNGIQFILRTDFRVWIQAGEIIQKIGKVGEIVNQMVKEKADETRITKKLIEKYELFSNLCDLVIEEYPKEEDYPIEEFPNGVYVTDDELLYGLVDFYKGFPKVDNEKKEKKKKNSNKEKPPTFDFFFDAGYIYCSFASFYHIRLQEVEYMHWWEFLELFNGLLLSDQTSFNLVVGARQQQITPKMSKPEKARLQKLKDQFELPKDEDTKKAQNKLADFLSKGKQNGTGTTNQD